MKRPSRILLLQDRPEMLGLMRDAIHIIGWRAQISDGASGAQALETLRRSHLGGTPPDLVLISCSLADDCYLDTLRVIRSYPGCRFQPIIVMASIMPTSSIIDALFSFHVLAVLEKPTDASGCVTLVRRIMSHFTREGDVTPQGSWISDRLTAVKASSRELQA
jgi:CheY-like chemotaxis protein